VNQNGITAFTGGQDAFGAFMVGWIGRVASMPSTMNATVSGVVQGKNGG